MNDRTRETTSAEEEDDRIPVDGPEQIPEFASEEEEQQFWRTHTFSEMFWETAPLASDAGLPPVRRESKKKQ